MPTKLMIAGASVRAHVESALRAGYCVHALDLFADRDTRLMIDNAADDSNSVATIGGFGELLNLESEIRNCDAAIVCGGIESRIELIRKLESQIKLLGPSSSNLTKLQNPISLSQSLEKALGKHGVKIPLTSATPFADSDCRSWLSKSIGSSGGLGVESVEQPISENFDAGNDGRKYFQERVAGENISALFVSSRATQSNGGQNVSAATTKLIGVTQQLVGDAELGASEFQYCGSIGPFDSKHSIGTLKNGLGEERIGQIELVGEFIGREFDLIGVWGIDFIVNNAGVWPVDINPRLTASAELYESSIASQSRFKSVIDLHAKACVETDDPSNLDGFEEVALIESKFYEAKAILFNRTSNHIGITDKLSDTLIGECDLGFFGSDRLGVTLADIPCPGQTIKPGRPLLTVRVRCGSSEETLVRLREHAERISRLL